MNDPDPELRLIAFRKALRAVHLYIGLLAAPFLAVLGLSGAVLVFEEPLDRAVNQRLLRADTPGPVLALAEVQRRLEQAHQGYRTVAVNFPADDGLAWAVTMAGPEGRPELDLFVDPHGARELGTLGEQRSLLRTVHQLHTRLLSGPTGQEIVGWAGVSLVLLSLSGLVLWWPGKILHVRWAGSRRRVIFELHNALGGACWLFLLLFGVTGMVIHWDGPALGWAARLTGASLPGPFPEAAPGCDRAPPLPLDQIVRAASLAVPGARVTRVYLPDAVAPARVIMKFPEDRTPAGRTNVFVASCSGQIVEARSSRAAPLAYRAVAMWNREIHTGDLWGWPTRLLACAVSLLLPAMALTGPIIWWRRRRKSWRSPIRNRRLMVHPVCDRQPSIVDSASQGGAAS